MAIIKLKRLLFEHSEKTLENWLPKEFFREFGDSGLNKLLDYKVIEEYGGYGNANKRHPFISKNIYTWCIISNGIKKYAVGWNESPSRGYSFPYKRLK